MHMLYVFDIWYFKEKTKSHLERMENTNDRDDTYEVNSKVFEGKSLLWVKILTWEDKYNQEKY